MDAATLKETQELVQKLHARIARYNQMQSEIAKCDEAMATIDRVRESQKFFIIDCMPNIFPMMSATTQVIELDKPIAEYALQSIRAKWEQRRAELIAEQLNL